ncbi:MAG: (Fe-S)-binding protein [Candidatus Nanoarchaeia archaeon]|nr:(Fe-S)-binding protein [Candidatus Nanoarchaeia archaeon]
MSFFKKLIERFTRTNTLYYPGCLTKFGLPDINKNYEDILKENGIDFIKSDDENCCGSPVLNAGYEDDFRTLVMRNNENFRKRGVKKIITNCPACFNMLKNIYPKYIDNWDFEIEHITQTIAKKLDKIRAKSEGTVFYHDPCHLGRHAGIYEEPRRIIEKIGYNIEENEDIKEKSICCGGGGGLRNNNIKLSKIIARKCMDCVKSKDVITTCPLCYSQLKEFTEKNVKELSQCMKNLKE